MMRKLFSAAVFFVVLFLSSPGFVKAVDNNDDVIPICDIIVGGAEAKLINDGLSTSYNNGAVRKFNIKVCNFGSNLPIGRTANQCIDEDQDGNPDRQLVVDVKHSSDFYESSRHSFNLEKRGDCYYGEISASTSWFSRNNNTGDISLDVQLDGSGGMDCAADYPVCRRMHSKILNEDIDANCSEYISDLCSAESINRTITINQPVVFSTRAHSDLLDKKCKYQRYYWQLTDPNDDETKTNLNTENARLGFTPSTIGVYTLDIYGHDVTDDYNKRDTRLCTVFRGEINDSDTLVEDYSDTSAETEKFNLCKQIPDPDDRAKCCRCQTGTDNCSEATPEETRGIWTAVGCIKTNSTDIIQSVMTIGLSIAGGVALLMFLAASFILSTSQGEPKRTSDAKEMITSAVIGLLFIVFSVTILQFIGVDILRIPGFGGS